MSTGRISDAMRLFNADARTRKDLVSSAYDPSAMRAAMAEESVLARQSRFEQRGPYKLERRGTEDPRRVLIGVAGGGFCFPATDRHRRLYDRLAVRLRAQVAVIRHRLAPEAPFPAAYEDVLDGIDAVIGAPGVERAVVVADSSGAALVLSALMTRRDRGARLPDRCVFLSPLTDLAMTGLSLVTNSRLDPMFGPEALIHKGFHYLKGANPTDPRASPYWGEHHDLPPMLLIVGSTEVMLDDSMRFADKVNYARGQARVDVEEEAPHVFPLVAELPEAERAFESMCRFLCDGA